MEISHMTIYAISKAFFKYFFKSFQFTTNFYRLTQRPNKNFHEMIVQLELL